MFNCYTVRHASNKTNLHSDYMINLMNGRLIIKVNQKQCQSRFPINLKQNELYFFLEFYLAAKTLKYDKSGYN